MFYAGYGRVTVGAASKTPYFAAIVCLPSRILQYHMACIASKGVALISGFGAGVRARAPCH